MRIKNLTPFLFGYKVSYRKAPDPEMTAIVRATFDIQPDGIVSVPVGHPLLVQGALTAEVYEEHDDEHKGECLYPGDFADFKLNAEVMLRGTCHTPNQAPTPDCPVRFAVGRWSKSLRVVGPRVFSGSVPGSSSKGPIPFSTMPLTYANAFGGPLYARNPVGKGYNTNEFPTIENPGDIISSRTDKLAPAGFGPLNPSWSERLAKRRKPQAKAPKENRGFPFYPDDFDWTYFQAAQADQVLEGYLAGDEELLFQNLHPTHQILKTRLPGLRIRVFIKDSDARFREIPMVLDTLFADLDKQTVALTFRGLTKVREVDLIDIKTALVASEPLAEPPLPREHYKAALEKFEADPYQLDERISKEMRPFAEEALRHGRITPPSESAPDPAADPISALIRSKLGSLAPREQERIRAAVAAVLAAPATPGIDLKTQIQRAVNEAQKAPPPAAAPAPGVVNLNDARTSGALKKLRGLVDKLRADAEKKNIKLQGLEAYDALMADPRLAGAASGAPPAEPGPEKDCSGQDYSGRDLRGRDLRGANFTGSIFTRADLSGANLHGASLKQAVLAEADLSDADLSGADFTTASLSSARAPRASFRGATLDQANFQRADLKGADFSEAKGLMAQFTRADLSSAKATRAHLTKALLRAAILVKADFSRATLIRCYLGECDITDAHFEEAILTKTSFAAANATRAKFVGAQGEESIWMEASLTETDFSYAHLERAFFMKAKIVRARFFGANMRGCQLYRAVMEHAEVVRANLAEANLRSATLTGTRFNDSNLFEASLDRAAGKGCDFSGANLKRTSLGGV